MGDEADGVNPQFTEQGGKRHSFRAGKAGLAEGHSQGHGTAMEQFQQLLGPWIMPEWLSCARQKLSGAIDHARLALPCQAEVLQGHGLCQAGSSCARGSSRPHSPKQWFLPWSKEGKGQSAPLLPLEGGWSLSSDTEVSVIFWQKVKPRSCEMEVPQGTQIAPLATAECCFPEKTQIQQL